MTDANEKLPDTMHELLALALDDLEKCTEDPEHYDLDMDEWHNPSEARGGPCRVCMAGAIMAQTLQVSHLEYCSPYDVCGPFEDHNSVTDKLFAINDMRTQDWGYAWRRVNGRVDPSEPVRRDLKEAVDKLHRLRLEEDPRYTSADETARWVAGWREAVKILKEYNL